MGVKFIAVLLSLMAVIAVGGMMGTAYAKSNGPTNKCSVPAHFDTKCPPGHSQRLDLLLRDQNESWRDSVTATWVANNMAPGDEYAFNGSFIGLRSNTDGDIGITCDYSVKEERPVVEPDNDPHTNLHPDKMAKQLIITRAIYKVGCWQIDLVAGGVSGMTLKEKLKYSLRFSRWRIQDTDHDGRITFYDLKHDSLSDLPISETKSNTEGARFLMSVKFAETARNDLQGDTFKLSMLYTLGN